MNDFDKLTDLDKLIDTYEFNWEQCPAAGEVKFAEKARCELTSLRATITAQSARIKALTDAGNVVVAARNDMDDYASGGYFDLDAAIEAWKTVLEADSE